MDAYEVHVAFRPHKTNIYFTPTPYVKWHHYTRISVILQYCSNKYLWIFIVAFQDHQSVAAFKPHNNVFILNIYLSWPPTVVWPISRTKIIVSFCEAACCCFDVLISNFNIVWLVQRAPAIAAVTGRGGFLRIVKGTFKHTIGFCAFLGRTIASRKGATQRVAQKTNVVQPKGLLEKFVNRGLAVPRTYCICERSTALWCDFCSLFSEREYFYR